MRTVKNPRQTELFAPFEPVRTERTRQALLDDWPGVFRHVILELMPVEILGGTFDPAIGRPTKELYSMAGLPGAPGAGRLPARAYGQAASSGGPA